VHIDLNVDTGESFGLWPMGHDEILFTVVTSANLACGFHAGDPLTIQKSVQLAKKHGVAIGAHPGFRDLVGFGRRDLALSPQEAYADTLYQLGALQAFVTCERAVLHHIKPHGALYLRMLREPNLARAVAQAVVDFSHDLPLVVLGGPGGRVMQEGAAEVGARTVLEAFPDRAYLPDGRLAPRGMEGSLVRDPALAAERAVAMVTQGRVEALGGGEAEVRAETLCIHGDNPEAPEIARAVRTALEEANVNIRPF
jgi:UPF0271 protein